MNYTNSISLILSGDNADSYYLEIPSIDLKVIEKLKDAPIITIDS